MHRDHRRRYHPPAIVEQPARYRVKPASDVYPGDRISTDPVAIAAAADEGNPQVRVDWPAVERDSRVVRDRNRPSPTRLTFALDRGGLAADTYANLLVIRPDVGEPGRR